MPAATAHQKNRWVEAGPDALAFALGLGTAWYFQWETRDLVWSLWLTGMVTGYAMIVWSLGWTGINLAAQVRRDREKPRNDPTAQELPSDRALLVWGLIVVVVCMAFFGGFNRGLSVFLNGFFPVYPGQGRVTPDLALYAEVLQRYWWFLPAAAIAERKAFRRPTGHPMEPPNPSIKPADNVGLTNLPPAVAGMIEPYKNIFRMCLLIFFFAGAHFAGLDNFVVYAVVYAVYFFPWRLLQDKPVPTPVGP